MTVSPQPTADDPIDWGAHRGSCRIFYAERRCTCAPPPLPRPPDLDPVTCGDLLTACTHDGPHVPVGLDCKPTGEVEPAPSAGQDTERLRDELRQWLARMYGGDEYAEQSGSNEHWTEMADELLRDVPALRRLIDQRDEARATVQRVREVVGTLEALQAKAVVAASGHPDGSLQRSSRIGRGTGYGVSADLLRTALDGPA